MSLTRDQERDQRLALQRRYPLRYVPCPNCAPLQAIPGERTCAICFNTGKVTKGTANFNWLEA